MVRLHLANDSGAKKPARAQFLDTILGEGSQRRGENRLSNKIIKERWKQEDLRIRSVLLLMLLPTLSGHHTPVTS